MKLILTISIAFLFLSGMACSSQAVEDSVEIQEDSFSQPTVSTSLSCDDQGRAFLKPANEIMSRWMDAREGAEFSTSLADYADYIAELQGLKAEWQVIPAPTCLTYVNLGEAKVAMNHHMSNVIEGYTLRMKNEPASTVDAKFDEASDWMIVYVSIMKVVLE